MSPLAAEAYETITERQFALLRVIATKPGATPDEVQEAIAETTGRRWALATLYKDIAALKVRGLLDPGRNRQGYHLAGAGFSHDELQVLLNGLRIQAEDLANPQAQALYDKLLRRAGPSRREQAFYSLPVEAIANRPVVRTTADGFADVMAHLREPLLRGQRVGVKLRRNPWAPRKQETPRFVLYPLQFIFHDVAWYLLAEDVIERRFVLMRVDRLHPALDIHEDGERGSAVQAERQALAREVLRRGWGTAMPNHDARGRLTTPLATFELRFAPEVASFIAENQLRHDSQRVRRQPDGATLFSVELPTDQAVVFHFRRWVLTWGRSVEVIGPAWFRDRIAAEHAELAATYARSAAAERDEEGIPVFIVAASD